MTDQATPTTQPSGLDRSTIVKLATAAVLLALLIIFAVQNVSDVEVEFLVWDFTIPLIVVIVGSAVIGVVTWQIGALVRRRRD